MKFKAATIGVLLAGLAVVGMNHAALAQTLGERVTVLEEKISERAAQAEDVLGLQFNALVSTTYNYSINNPSSDDIGMRIYNTDHNAFDLRDGVLAVSRNKDDEPFGFAIVMDFGRSAVQGNGTDYGFTDTSDNRVFDVREAFLTYKTPLQLPGGPISLKAGKFVTLLGWEVLLDPLNEGYNDNVSLSLLSGFSIPFTHTGLLANLPFNDMIDLTIGVVNGLDNVKDNNNGKTLLAGLGISPTDNLDFYIAGTYGAEDAPTVQGGAGSPTGLLIDGMFPQLVGVEGGAGAGSKTGILTANMFLQATDRLGFVLDATFADVSGGMNFFDDGIDDGLDGVITNGRTGANWYGVGAYALIAVTDKLQLTLRGEWFDDPDGVKTGVINGATLWEVSPTISYWFNDHLLGRLEYRHDESSKPLFPAENGQTWRGQDVFSAEILVTL